MKYFTIKALLISFCFITLSCEKKEILGNDITILTPVRNLSTVLGTDIYTSDLLIEPDTSDTLRFKLTEKDWAILRESFDKNQIYLINDNTKIGRRVNSIYMPDRFKIRTNKRLLSLQYRYFIGEGEKFDSVKSISFNKFMKTFDSLAYYRSRGK
ncbi:hypothetical protein BBI01_16210 [Chryseobacterium artocarpi]|uniref:Uncharacterized protein n=1 Tax=Chryseobacterium artocarpi TaxID=1414727 RepID=A0A1B8ZDK7_9FLAO|nr:hypothetical protein [Chryseobacterium artocarpi]OCA69675.1 hypothetical protein BBI01_16210 [Chryseobacterium artocarpi]